MTKDGLLLIDHRDEASRLAAQLQARGLQVERTSGKEARARLEGHSFDAVVVNLDVPNVSGIDLVACAKRNNVSAAVVATVARADVRAIVAAVKAGAVDVLEQPADALAIWDIVGKDRGVTVTGSAVELGQPLDFDPFLENSSVMRALLERVDTDDRLLALVGDTSLGVDRLVERYARRRTGPTITVAGDESNSESFLFGSADQPSAFSMAKDGVVYVPSVAALSRRAQLRLAKLISGLRASSSDGWTRWPSMLLAADGPIDDESRIHPKLAAVLQDAKVALPSIGERSGDVAILLERIAANLQKVVGAHSVDPHTLQTFAKAPFPAKVRELAEAVTRSARLDENSRLVFDSAARAPEPVEEPVVEEASGWSPSLDSGGEVQPYDVYEAEIFRFALERTGGCVSRAAQLLEVGRATMYRKMRAYSIALPPVSERGNMRKQRS